MLSPSLLVSSSFNFYDFGLGEIFVVYWMEETREG